MKNEDWYNKSVDEIYEHFEDLPPDEAINFLIHLLKHYPKLDVEWIELLLNIKDDLIFDKIKKVEEFVDLYAQIFPEEYADDYEFIEKDLVSYYLFKGSRKNIIKRLNIVEKNPVSGVDTMTISVMFQLIYYGYYTEALNYSKAVWKPLYESDQIMISAHYDFCTTIYLHALEEKYMHFKEGKPVDWEEFIQKMRQYDIEYEKDVLDVVTKALSEPLNTDFIKTKITANDYNIPLYLNIQFLKYMKEQFTVPFMFSDRVCNILTSFGPFSEGDDPDAYFYMPFSDLKKYFFRLFDRMFLSNDVEMFGKVWGLSYVYSFLYEHGLISRHYYDLMLENISALKSYFMNFIRYNLWKMSFVKNWPHLKSVHDPDGIEAILSTFPEEEYNDKLDDYLENKSIPQRIKMEINMIPENKITSYSEPYVKTVDVGRNDPCLCGSGKKYKKCCL